MSSDDSGAGIAGIFVGLAALGGIGAFVAWAIVLMTGGILIGLVLLGLCVYILMKIIQNAVNDGAKWWLEVAKGLSCAFGAGIGAYIIGHLGVGLWFGRAIDASYGPPDNFANLTGWDSLIGYVLILITLGSYVALFPYALWTLGDHDYTATKIGWAWGILIFYWVLMACGFQYFLAAKGAHVPSIVEVLTFRS